MRKKVLLAERSDATRSVAETILRQHGYDVVAVTESDAAVQVLQTGKPDLVLVGADLIYQDAPLYRSAADGTQGSRAPVLVIAEAGREVPGVAAGAVIASPFHPRDLLDRVTAFVQSGGAGDPLEAFSDDLLDSALGMGATGPIDVTASEVMERTQQTGALRGLSREEGIAAYGRGDDNDDANRTGRVESIMITEEATDIRRPGTGKVARTAPPAADDTGGLDILPNQYGLSGPGEFSGGSGSDSDSAHDYHLFVSEMQREANAPAESGTARPAAGPAPAEELTFTDPASTLERFNPATYPDSRKKGETAGVERFIDEFKREIERFQAEEPESLTLQETPPRKAEAASWEEVVENVTPDRVALFTRQLAAELAERIAAKIVGKLDADKLAHLIKTEVIAQLRTRKDRQA
ncbi:MAG TPA: hypothetical protein PLR32_04325 [candidate division Zixibacteria bacterium]|mgnify:FL=1|nr:hypothetical protein [candidate division Zixibacteria bacterium]